MSDSLLGAPSSYVQGQSYPSYGRNFYFGAYLQDSWRIKPNLTLTGGLRYTLLQPPYETHGNQAAPSISMSDFLKNRGAAMFAGQIAVSPLE